MNHEVWINVLLAGLPGVIIAILFPWLIDRRADWRETRRSLMLDFKRLYDSVESISKVPHRFNGYTFKFLFVSESLIIKHYAKSFFSKRQRMMTLAEMTRKISSDLLLNSYYEELLLLSGEKSSSYNEFLTEVQQRISLLNALLLNF